MPSLHIDFETRGVLDLKEAGLYRYARHGHTSVWCMAWAIDDAEPQIWTPGMPLPPAVRSHVNAGGRVVAHNAPFELEIWNAICVSRWGFPMLTPGQTHCTMVAAYAMGLPGALEEAAMALGLSVLKDAEGRALMLRMARPRRMERGSPVWWDEPVKLQRLYAYCQQDVRVERELEKRLMPLSHKERRVWLMDYAINSRGVMVDIPTAEAAVKLADKMKADANEELSRITAGKVQAVSALIPFKQWLAEQGVPAEGLAKADVADLLTMGDALPPAARRALTIRQEVGKASTAKLEPMIAIAGPDNRVRNIFQMNGAGTGRWAGRKIQPHNFPRDVPDEKTIETVLFLIRAGKFDAIDAIFGPPMTVLSRCLRAFFIAPPGKRLISGDFSAVEGRGTAWFSGEEWKLAAFRAADAKTGPGIYELAYAKAFGVPVESVKNPSFERQVGKVMELAFGYEGGVGAFRTMGTTLGVDVPDAKADEYKRAWRAAHPQIVRTWKQLKRAAINAVRQPGTAFEAGHPGRHVTFKVAGSFLWCLLPSGRCLCYPYPKLLADEYGDKLTYMTVPSADDRKKGRIVDDPANTPKWARVGTYGGSLMENVIQAICRDLLVDCMLALHDAGAAIVMHVHDEIVIEVDEAKVERASKAMGEIMSTAPSWAAGFPLFTKPEIGTRYGV